MTTANRSVSRTISSIAPSRTSTRSDIPAASALRRAKSQATGLRSMPTSRRSLSATASNPIWPAPEHSSSTAPGGAVGRISPAHSDWAAVQGRGSSTRSSYAIRSRPKSMSSGSVVVALMDGRYPTATPAKRSEDVERAELHRHPWTGMRDLGYGVLPRALARAAHDQQVAVAHLDRDRRPTDPRSQREPARVAEGDDRDHRVLGLAAADGVAVPGDAVATIAVVAAAGGHERLAELGAVVRRQRSTGPRQGRMGERLADAVRVQQAGYGDLAVVHLPSLRAPRHVLHHG